ncbi:MAG: glucose-1-phosphate adenylyltransferase [Pirellulales bacterium]|nr:glucose-1-phosphate adenylyltransferase [Pirellulales bacterium]
MKNLITFVLGGGRGTRLYPLTKYRSKPAVPLAGKYRLIDIPLSNCIHSGLDRIYVLTQFHSVSLHRHIGSTYTFDAFSGGFVEILAAQQTLGSSDWYQGTADAVRQNLPYLEQPHIDLVLILSGDQLYRMDYRELIDIHRRAGAEVTISTVPVHSKDASGLGIMRMDENGRIVRFVEKPKTPEALAPVRTDPSWIDARGIASRGRDCLASTGIYLFNRDTLFDLLEKHSAADFGKEILPAAINSHRVHAHLFDDYWEDIGTVRAFYEANLAMASNDPPFHLILPEKPIYSRARFLPPTYMDGATVRGSLVADGCVIEEGAVIENSIVGLRCRIGRNVTIRNSVLMGNDFHQTAEEIAVDLRAGKPPVGVGEGTVIDGAIIDKNCRIGRNVRVANTRGVQDREEADCSMICDGVPVVSKLGILPDGWTL